MSKIVAPDAGPTAKLSVAVTNFAPDRTLTNIENVYLTLKTNDDGWGGQQIIKNDQPQYDFVIPANKDLSYVINLMQGGGGFSGSCGVQFELSVPANANLSAKFTLIRANGPEVIGCTASLYSGNKLIGNYKGNSEITRYKVQFL